MEAAVIYAGSFSFGNSVVTYRITDLKKNGYTASFIRRVYRRQARCSTEPRCGLPVIEPPSSPARRPAPRISLPYVEKISETLSRVLTKEGIRVAHKPTSTLGSWMPRPKGRPPKEKAPGVVYKIPCAECPARYIGETKNLKERILQRKNDVRKFEMQRGALAEHNEKLDHLIKFEDAKMIDTEANPFKMALLESWHIQATPGNINRSLGALPSVYTPGLWHVTIKLPKEKEPVYITAASMRL